MLCVNWILLHFLFPVKRSVFRYCVHWKATIENHKTKNILHVKEILGHRSVNNTLVYIQLFTFESNDFHSATAKKIEEARQLVEAGFEYVCDIESCKLFRKQKRLERLKNSPESISTATVFET